MDEEFFNSSYDESLWSFPVLDDQNNMGITNNNIVEYGENMDAVNVEAPPLDETKSSALATATKTGGDGGGGRTGGGVERERRKKMNDLYANLLALMPHLHPKVDKCTMVDEAANYIKKLQETLVLLQKKKAEKAKAPMIRSAFSGSQRCSSMAINNSRAVALANPSRLSAASEIKPTTFTTWTSSNVILNVSGKDAHINIICGKEKPGFLTGICCVMEKYRIEVVSAQLSSDGSRRMCMIHARANVGFPVVSTEAVYVVEEIYKKAAQDMIMWLNSI